MIGGVGDNRHRHSYENNPRPISRRGDSRIALTAIFMIGGVGGNRRRARMARAIMDRAAPRTAWQPITPRTTRRFMTSSGIFHNLPRVLGGYRQEERIRSHPSSPEPCPVPDAASSGKRPRAMAYPPSPLSPCAMLSPRISCSPCFSLTFRSPSSPSRESMCYTNRGSGMCMNNKVQLLDTHSPRWYCSGIHV